MKRSPIFLSEAGAGYSFQFSGSAGVGVIATSSGISSVAMTRSSGHKRQFDVHSIFKDRERTVRCRVAETRADARPAASNPEGPLPVKGVLAGKFPAGKAVDLHLTDTAVSDAA
jgi:hypothetical protein